MDHVRLNRAERIVIFFKLYALDIKLSLPNGATKNEVLNAQQGHILATAELMGTYER